MTKVVFREGAFSEIRTLPKVMGLIDAKAEQIAAGCGDGYEAKPTEATGGRVRARAAVVTTGPAIRAEAKHHRLANSV